MNVAIDGPAGAGKSTIAKILAKELGFLYLDTGAMYRAVALKMLRTGISVQDEKGIEAQLTHTEVDVCHKDGKQCVLLDGEDVSDSIRTPEISSAASTVSKYACVRGALLSLQRSIAARSDVILDGRDIGTVVLPKAEYKFFLTASVEERAARRYKELTEKGVACSFEDIKRDIETRDYNDSHRTIAPLRKADDAVEIDTTHLTIEEVVAKMQSIIGK